ncbi:unnamed protein product, partial [Brachionus calyciflorus]
FAQYLSSQSGQNSLDTNNNNLLPNNNSNNNTTCLQDTSIISMLSSLGSSSTNRLQILPNSNTETNYCLSTLSSHSALNSISDLINDAELLEQSTRRNDKYTVRRILDLHYSFFRIKQIYSQKTQTTNSIPHIFYNILHISIENNSLDVLRICLKYGINPNECGVAKNQNDFKPIFNCTYCKHVNKDNNLNVKTSSDGVDYSLFNYLITLPPLFLSISKCNHQATELLLSYGACPNIQDSFGNTPLHLAVAKPDPCYECTYLLLKYHANSSLINNNFKNSIDILNQVVQSKKLDDKKKWDYSIQAVYSSLIQDLFKKLDLVTQSKSKLSSEMNSQSPKNDKQLFFTSMNKSLKNLNKSFTLQQNSKTNSLKNISKLTSSNSLFDVNDSKSDSTNTKQLFVNVKKIFRNQSSNSDANLNSVKRHKAARIVKKEPSEIKSLITVLEPSNKSKSLVNCQTLIDPNENYLLRKYARYSKSPASKAGSAVVRIPTFNQSIRIDKINRQTSLSNFMINKLNSIRNLNSSFALYGSNRPFHKQNTNNSNEHYNVNNSNTNDNVSVISSKMSLFKKPISQSQHLKSNKNHQNVTNSISSLQQQQNQDQQQKQQQQTQQQLSQQSNNPELKTEKYEAIFKLIFSELDKYSSYVECAQFIMEQIQLHLKELLDTINYIHTQVVGVPSVTTQDQTVNHNENHHLITKLEDLLNTLIQTCYEDFTKPKTNENEQTSTTTNESIHQNLTKEILNPLYVDSLTNFNSAKSKKFQTHTRKLIELSLDLLHKTQLPSVQYIAFTTINRIFDIYVYHNLFYPGYYESCYIPKSKRQKSPKQQQHQQNTTTVNFDVNNKKENDNQFIQLTKPNKTQKYCSCKTNLKSSTIHPNNLSRIKERSSTIHEDPSSIESQSLKNEPVLMSIMKRPELHKNSSFNTLTRRLGGFFRMFSINSSFNSNSDSGINYEGKNDLLMCSNCKKQINFDRINVKQKLVKSEIVVEKEEEGDHADNNNNKEIKEDNFTTSILLNKNKKNNDGLKQRDNGEKLDTNDLNSNYLNQPIKCLASSLEPRFLLQIVHDRLESHKSVDINATTAMNSNNNNNQQQQSTTTATTTTTTTTCNTNPNSKVKCLPSARTIQCQHHCVAILATRLFAILCNEQAFQVKLMNENQEVSFNLIVDILYPNNDPHLLCLMLQALGLLALRPEYHDMLLKFDLPDTIMSLILPGDELFYTNQTTKYPKYVKHLAARVLVYLGLFAKVSNKVNLFDVLEMHAEQIDLDKPQSFENNFIHHMAIGENLIMNMWRLNAAAISIEKLLDDILKEIKADNLDKIQFSFNENSDFNLRFNMSYLCTLVHPLIIIRLLEHRLFTPLLKKSNSRAPTSLSLTSQFKNLSSSTSFPSNQHLNTGLSKSYRKCSEGVYEKLNKRKPSQLSLSDKLASTNTKTAYLKDLSKRILKRVNSGNQFTFSKKSFKYSKVNRKNSCDRISLDSFDNQSIDRKPTSRSNTNSLDRSYVLTNDLNQIEQQQQQPDLKEFEKKLINLPTFTISDECALPSSSCLALNNNTKTNENNLILNKTLTTTTLTISKSLTISNKLSILRNQESPSECCCLAEPPRRKSDLLELMKKNMNSIFRKRNSLSLNYLYDNNSRYRLTSNNSSSKNHKSRATKSLNELSNNLKNLFNRNDEIKLLKNSLTDDGRMAMSQQQQDNKKNYLKAPKRNSRRGRSNSPLCQHHHDQISIGLNKSYHSTNSTFSGGFLPSPDMNTPIVRSSSDVKTLPKNYSLGVMALTAATTTIGSSLILTNEQQENVKNQLSSFHTGYTTKFTNKKLTTSSSLTPIKITIHNDGDDVNGHLDGLNKSKSNSQIQTNSNVLKHDKRNLSYDNSNSRKKSTIESNATIKATIKNQESSANIHQVYKPGSEVLNLISLWIKNSPNDFLDTRVLDEIKHFFSQLDTLKSSFKPWTKKLKQALKLDENETVKENVCDTINKEDIINQYQIVSLIV